MSEQVTGIVTSVIIQIHFLHDCILITPFHIQLTENEFPLLAGHLKLIKTLFTCEGVDKKGLGK